MDDIESDDPCFACSAGTNNGQPTITPSPSPAPPTPSAPVSSTMPLDEFSIIHMLSGVCAYTFMTHSTLRAVAFHTLFEYIENNGWPFNKLDVTHIFNSKSYTYNGDSVQNSIADGICFTIGFVGMKYYNEGKII